MGSKSHTSVKIVERQRVKQLGKAPINPSSHSQTWHVHVSRNVQHVKKKKKKKRKKEVVNSYEHRKFEMDITRTVAGRRLGGPVVGFPLATDSCTSCSHVTVLESGS